jgi:hypothetical protein
MQKSAIDKAKDRLASAKARLKDLESAKDYDTARRQWYEFLLCSNAVFSVLEQGSKGFNKSSAWFGKKKQERKSDPLLCYLQHARNADEHNVPSVTELDLQKIVMVEDGKPVAEIRDMVGNKGTFFSLSDNASPNLTNINEMRIYPDRAKLIRVRDRGVNYDPPTEHLGSIIHDNGPISIASLMVQYIESLAAEAESLMPKR